MTSKEALEKITFFTDKLPKSCLNCPCADGEYGICNIDYNIGTDPYNRPKECPLQEVKHGQWLDCGSVWEDVDEYQVWRCSECIIPNYKKSCYCPNCGTKMDGKEKLKYE